VRKGDFTKGRKVANWLTESNGMLFLSQTLLFVVTEKNRIRISIKIR
jgi:hypothetical protein